RRSFGLRRDSSHVASAQARDQILALGPVGHRVLEVPAKEATVELRRSIGVGLGGVDPAGHAGDISVSLGHRSLLPVWWYDHRSRCVVRRALRAEADRVSFWCTFGDEIDTAPSAPFRRGPRLVCPTRWSSKKTNIATTTARTRTKPTRT